MSDDIIDQEDNLDAPGIENRLKLQQVLTAFEAFMASPGYEYYLKARRIEYHNLESDIVHLEPIDRKDEIESFKLRGDLRTTLEFINLFNGTVSHIKDRLEAMLEAEQPTDTTETQE